MGGVLHAAEDAGPVAEVVHANHRVETCARQRRLGPLEVDVGRRSSVVLQEVAEERRH